MSEFGPTPVLTDPEVREAEEKGELIEPRDAERLAYEFKVGMEELHVIADDVGKYVNYENLFRSQLFQSFEKDTQLFGKIIEKIKAEKEKSQKINEIFDQYDYDTQIKPYRRAVSAVKKSVGPEQYINLSEDEIHDLVIKELSERVLPRVLAEASVRKQMGERFDYLSSKEADEEIDKVIDQFHDSKSIAEDAYSSNKEMLQQLSECEKAMSDSEIMELLEQEYLAGISEKDRSAAQRKFDLNFLMAKTEILGGSENKQIDLNDLIILWNEFPDEVMDLVFDYIADEGDERLKTAKNNSEVLQNTSADLQETMELIEAQTLGQSLKLDYILASHFESIAKKLSDLTDEQKNSIRSYGSSASGEVRVALNDLSQLSRGIKAATVAKSQEIVREPSKTAKIYKAEEGRFAHINARVERRFKERYGKEITIGVERIYNEHQDAVDKDFLTSYVNYRQELRSLYSLLSKGRIVETDYMRGLIERALPELQKNPPTIVYFHGDFGTGKTALAMHIARTRLGKEPIIVSGSKFLDPDRFTEEFRIQKLPINQFLMKIYKDMGEDKIIDEDTPFSEIIMDLVGSKNDMREHIISEYIKEYKSRENIPQKLLEDLDEQVQTLYSNQVQGRYVMGAMYSAMEEGRPLIIDEANAISPEVLIAFNDLLTKKIGSSIHSRTDKGTFKIREGYCIMWTGNTGDRYKNARFNNTDPAAFSRITPIEVRYLPNNNTYNSIDADIKRLDLEKISAVTFEGMDVEAFVKEKRSEAANDQIFQVLVTKILNRRLGAELLVKSDDRYSIFKDLYRLSVGARWIMDLFEGSVDPNTFPPLGISNIVGSDETATLRQTLQKANLSMRALMDNIVGGYLDGGCNMDIEYYLWKFVKNFDGEPKEQAIIYAILKQARFFTDKGWPEYSDIGGDGAIEEFKKRMSIEPVNSVEKYTKIRKNGAFTSLLETGDEYTLQYFSSIEMLQLIFGYLPPRKKEEYEKIGRKITESKSINLEDEQKMRLLEQITGITPKIANIENYETSEDCEKLIAKMKELPISNKAKREAMDDNDFLKGVNEFYDTLIRFAEESGKIDEETADSALEGSLEDKNTLVNSIFK